MGDLPKRSSWKSLSLRPTGGSWPFYKGKISIPKRWKRWGGNCWGGKEKNESRNGGKVKGKGKFYKRREDVLFFRSGLAV